MCVEQDLLDNQMRIIGDELGCELGARVGLGLGSYM